MLYFTSCLHHCLLTDGNLLGGEAGIVHGQLVLGGIAELHLVGGGVAVGSCTAEVEGRADSRRKTDLRCVIHPNVVELAMKLRSDWESSSIIQQLHVEVAGLPLCAA